MGCRFAKLEEKKWEYFENFKNHLKPLPIDKILLGQSLKHLVKVWKVLEINLKSRKLLFPYSLVESFKIFRPILTRNHDMIAKY